MSVTAVHEAGPLIAGWLVKLFEAHGIATRTDGDVVRFPAFPDRWAGGMVFKHVGYHPLIAQMDIRLGLEDDRVICESVVGMGDTLESQVQDGVKAIAGASLHVLLSAFFGTEPCHGTDVYRMTIHGTERVIHVGPTTSRLGIPTTPDGNPDLSFFQVVERHLANHPLPGGAHWVRVYLSRGEGLAPTNEVLVDNDHAVELEQAMAPLYTPPPQKRMDMRVFLVVQDAPTA